MTDTITTGVETTIATVDPTIPTDAKVYGPNDREYLYKDVYSRDMWHRRIKTRNVLCADGVRRTVWYTREADMSGQDGYCHAYGKTISGFVSLKSWWSTEKPTYKTDATDTTYRDGDYTSGHEIADAVFSAYAWTTHGWLLHTFSDVLDRCLSYSGNPDQYWPKRYIQGLTQALYNLAVGNYDALFNTMADNYERVVQLRFWVDMMDTAKVWMEEVK